MHAYEHLGHTVRLGKGAPKQDDRTLRLAKYLRAVPPAPLVRRWSDAVPSWPMFANDVLGDCTCAALAHAMVCWNANNSSPWRPTDKQVVEAYMAVGGYDPEVPGTDNGALMLDALNHARRLGIGGRKIDAFVALDVADDDQIKAAINLFGGVYFGLDLPQSAQNQATWSVSLAGTQGNAARGSWGGHAAFAVDYDEDLNLSIVTWGGLQQVSRRWRRGYGDEGYAILSRDWADADGAPNLFDYDALRADLAAVAA